MFMDKVFYKHYVLCFMASLFFVLAGIALWKGNIREPYNLYLLRTAILEDNQIRG